MITPSIITPSTLDALTDINERILFAIEELSPSTSEAMVARHTDVHSNDSPVKKVIDRFCHDLSSELASRLQDEYFSAGPLEKLFADVEITEIIVNGADSIWYEKGGHLQQFNDQFLSDLTYRNFVHRMCREAGIQPNLDCPFADGQWRNSRVHLIIPPASGTQAVITLRRHPQSPWTLDLLERAEWASAQTLNTIRSMVENRSNFLIVGGTGSGKTSLLNACLNELPTNERTLIIEDTSELQKPNHVSTKLLTRQDNNRVLRTIDQTELLRQALRMRPDRIVMGEIRGGEAKDLLMAFATGHTGCMGTLHADSARQALLRLEMLIQLGAPQWNIQAVRTLILLSLKAIIVVHRDRKGRRALEGIYKICSLEEIGFLLEKTL